VCPVADPFPVRVEVKEAASPACPPDARVPVGRKEESLGCDRLQRLRLRLGRLGRLIAQLKALFFGG
jgi:hypothetical protein